MSLLLLSPPLCGVMRLFSSASTLLSLVEMGSYHSPPCGLVQQIVAIYRRDCGFNDKSMKLLTVVD